MRLEAPTARGMVWHCELAQEVKLARWADDETNEVGVYGPRAEHLVNRYRKVLIVNATNPVLVLVNPIEDEDLANMREDAERVASIFDALERTAWKALT